MSDFTINVEAIKPIIEKMQCSVHGKFADVDFTATAIVSKSPCCCEDFKSALSSMYDQLVAKQMNEYFGKVFKNA